jgi:hypothetical protein
LDELRIHLDGNTSKLFPPEELNHVLLMVYGVLRRAVLDGSDTLHLGLTRVTWSRQGAPLGELRIDYTTPAVSFRAALKTIVVRDPIVQRHLQLIGETPQELIYVLQDMAELHAA